MLTVIQLLKLELAWASHIGLAAVMMEIADLESMDVLRALNSLLSAIGQTTVWIRMSLSQAQGQQTSLWDEWNRVRSVCEAHPNLGIGMVPSKGFAVCLKPDAMHPKHWNSDPSYLNNILWINGLPSPYKQ